MKKIFIFFMSIFAVLSLISCISESPTQSDVKYKGMSFANGLSEIQKPKSQSRRLSTIVEEPKHTFITGDSAEININLEYSGSSRTTLEYIVISDNEYEYTLANGSNSDGFSVLVTSSKQSIETGVYTVDIKITFPEFKKAGDIVFYELIEVGLKSVVLSAAEIEDSGYTYKLDCIVKQRLDKKIEVKGMMYHYVEDPQGIITLNVYPIQPLDSLDEYEVINEIDGRIINMLVIASSDFRILGNRFKIYGEFDFIEFRTSYYDNIVILAANIDLLKEKKHIFGSGKVTFLELEDGATISK